MARQQEADAKQRPRQFIMDLPTAIRPGPRYDLVTGKIIEEDEPEPVTKPTDRPASLPTSGQALRDSGQALRTSGQAEDGPYKGARENQKAPASEGGRYKTAAGNHGSADSATKDAVPSSASPTSSTSSSSSSSSPSPRPKWPPPVVDLNHFFPRDPSLPVSLQDPSKLAPPPLSQAEIDRRNARFYRVHGYRRWPRNLINGR